MTGRIGEDFQLFVKTLAGHHISLQMNSRRSRNRRH
jgi:hypothetical protein